MTVELSDQELAVFVGAVGAILNSMSLDVPSGQPLPPEMLMMEQLQTKLMNLIHPNEPA